MTRNFLDGLRQDARYALRGARNSPGFAGVAVLTLALGVGANTAIFSVVQAVLLQPLPFQDPDRLVRIVEHIPASESVTRRPERVASLAIEDLADWRARSRTLSHIGLHADVSMTLTGRETAVRLRGARVSPAIFPMLGLRPALGRVFASGDERRAADAVVILGHGAWQRHFDADPAIVGKRATLDGRDHVVVGVMPTDGAFPDRQTELWIPFVPQDPQVGRIGRAPAIARLADGMSIETATQEANAIGASMRGSPGASALGDRFEIVGLQDQLVAPVRPALLVLVAAVGAVLLIACANVANLLLARSAGRRVEMAIRGALGASRGRLMRQALTESLVLALAGGLAGLAIGAAMLRLVTTLATVDAPRWLAAGSGSLLPSLDRIGIDGAVLAFTASVACLTGLVCGLAPALHVARRSHMDVMKGVTFASLASATLTASRPLTRWLSRGPASGLLVVTQIGLATMLLIGATLLVRSFVNLSRVDAGYDPADVLTFQVALPPGRDASDPHRARIATRAIERIQGLPQVRAAGFTSVLPLTTARWMLSFGIPGLTLEEIRRAGAPQTRYVSRDYLRAMGVRLLEGRWLDERDGEGRARVLLINRALARRFFRDASPVRSIVTLNGEPWEIVGVVEDVRQGSLDQEADPQWFIDYRQLTAGLPSVPIAGGVFFVVRTKGAPLAIVPTVRAIVQQLEPKAALDSVYEMRHLVSSSLARPRFYAVLVGLLAVLAGALAAIGIAGVMACVVTLRTREIGIRMALGAQRRQVLFLVLGQGSALILTGLAFGLAGAVALTRYLGAMLFGLSPLDPVTLAVVPAGFAGLALLASYVPARRAATVDPMLVLRD